ncbi:MAG: methyltransferase domain-containing protein [Candidatus Omnitrophica bacterium]|nr:methyltransferase domain-containing protein [Candidatus Omnitrophota bacterium]
MHMLDVNRIRQSFTRASGSYEENAHLQKRIGFRLFENVKNKNVKAYRILDIGLGTGWMGIDLAKFYQAEVLGVDSAFGMVYVSRKRGIKTVQAEACNLPFKNKAFDLAVSNLTYQWVPDLSGAFSEGYRVLKFGSSFHFNCFAKDTLKELKLAFNATGGRDFFNGSELPNIEKIRLALQKSGFRKISLNNEKYCEYFDDLFSLLRWLKAIGANCLKKPKFIKRDLFHKADDFYQANFRENGKVLATFDVIEACAEK